MTDVENFNLTLKKAEKGDSNAQCTIGYYYETGKGVTKNIYEAVRWYEKSANQGNAIALYNLGCCYFNGNGVKRDYKLALKYYKLSAKKGYAKAMNNIGWSYHKGYGVKTNRRIAIYWYKKAAEKGNEKAIQNLRNLGQSVYDYDHTVGGSKPVKVLWLIWIALSIAFLGYSAITGFSNILNLPNIRTDFLNYVIYGGVFNVFFLFMSIWGVSQLLFIGEILKGSRTYKTPRKIYITYFAIIFATIIYFIVNAQTNGFNWLAFITALYLEIALMLFTATSAESIVYFSYNGLELYALATVFFFFLTSWIDNTLHNFLSVLTAIPVIVFLGSSVLGIIIGIFEKQNIIDEEEMRKSANRPSKKPSQEVLKYEPPVEEKPKEEPKKQEPKEDLKYYHYKTVIYATAEGQPEKDAYGLYVQKYGVDCTFYFKNCKGKEKTEQGAFTLYRDVPYEPTAKDAEEHFKYKLDPKD